MKYTCLLINVIRIENLIMDRGYYCSGFVMEYVPKYTVKYGIELSVLTKKKYGIYSRFYGINRGIISGIAPEGQKGEIGKVMNERRSINLPPMEEIQRFVRGKSCARWPCVV